MGSVSINIIRPFLKESNIDWSGIMQTSVGTIIMMDEMKLDAQSQNGNVFFLMDTTYKGKRVLFDYKITEEEFVLSSRKHLLKFNLSKKWKAYLGMIEKDQSLDGEDLFV